jgi:hypothetical protein
MEGLLVDIYSRPQGREVAMRMRSWWGWTIVSWLCASVGAAEGLLAPAEYRDAQPVVPSPDGTIFCEAEEFAIQEAG